MTTDTVLSIICYMITIMHDVCNQQKHFGEYAVGRDIEKSGYLVWRYNATSFSYFGSLAFNRLREKLHMCIFCQKNGF